MIDPIWPFDYIMLGVVLGTVFGVFYAKLLFDKRLKKAGLTYDLIAPNHTCPIHGKERCRCDLFSNNHSCNESLTPWQRFWDLQGKVHWQELAPTPESKQWWKDQPPSGVA